ncbi:predicted protein [Histoplasma capsulatum var. duboisii H88]|uniref:Predicted protein n=2 Tax=Ajellomyces capsulatus TaxID=5037 RepID=F0U891_AJEC8|nr:predicted protein [Histoplasma capsulatum H143]EGC42496.1 predicted protein [Histoplasma capsulatum var. duboisii H88]
MVTKPLDTTGSMLASTANPGNVLSRQPASSPIGPTQRAFSRHIVQDRDTTSGPLGYLTRATWRKGPTKARSADQPTIPCHSKGRAIFVSQIWQIAPKIVYALDNPRIQQPRKGSFKSCIIAPWDRKTGALSHLRPTGVSDAFRQSIFILQ